MKKRLLSLVLALFMLLSLQPACLAAEAGEESVSDLGETFCVNQEEEIERALNGITDVPITEEIRQMVTASVSSATRIDEPVEVYYTIRNLGETAEGTVYALTATASTEKTETGSEQTNYKDVNVRVSGTMYWTDGLGSDNTFDRVTGRWDCYDGSYTTERRVGIGGRTVLLISVFSYAEYPDTNSFDYTVGRSAHYLDCLIAAKCYAANRTDWYKLELKLNSSMLS